MNRLEIKKTLVKNKASFKNIMAKEEIKDNELVGSMYLNRTGLRVMTCESGNVYVVYISISFGGTGYPVKWVKLTQEEFDEAVSNLKDYTYNSVSKINEYMRIFGLSYNLLSEQEQY